MEVLFIVLLCNHTTPLPLFKENDNNIGMVCLFLNLQGPFLTLQCKSKLYITYPSISIRNKKKIPPSPILNFFKNRGERRLSSRHIKHGKPPKCILKGFILFYRRKFILLCWNIPDISVAELSWWNIFQYILNSILLTTQYRSSKA